MRPITAAKGSQRETSQTLDRGLAILTILADSQRPMTPAELAAEMKISRPIVYRLLKTLAYRRLVVRAGDGAYGIGVGVLDLTRRVAPDLQRVAAPELTQLAKQFDATAILVVADGDDAVCLATVEPPGPHIRLRYPPGFRNPLELTASGMAILAARDPVQGERKQISEARQRGYATSFGDIQSEPGVAVAAPITSVNGSPEASLAVASLDAGRLDQKEAAVGVLSAAQRIVAALS